MLEKELHALRLADLNLPPVSTERVGGLIDSRQRMVIERAEEYQAVDSSNSLWVTVDKKGKVLRFEVSSSWSSRLPAGDFGNALLRTYVSACHTAAVVESGSRRHERDQAALIESETSESDAPDLDVWLARIRTRLVDLDLRLREARADDDTSRRVTETRGPNGYVSLQLRSGRLVGLTTNAPALSRANPGRLQQDLWAVFTDAGLTSSRASMSVHPASPYLRQQNPSAAELEHEDELWKGFGRP